MKKKEKLHRASAEWMLWRVRSYLVRTKIPLRCQISQQGSGREKLNWALVLVLSTWIWNRGMKNNKRKATGIKLQTPAAHRPPELPNNTWVIVHWTSLTPIIVFCNCCNDFLLMRTCFMSRKQWETSWSVLLKMDEIFSRVGGKRALLRGISVV